MKSKSEAIVALSVVAAALLLTFALTLAIGKFQFGSEITVKCHFPSVTGVSRNTLIKYAGADVGRVVKIVVLPKNEWAAGPDGKTDRVELTATVNSSVVLDKDITAAIRQDGLLSPQYIALVPGATLEPLPPGAIIPGAQGASLMDLTAPVMGVLNDIGPALQNLQPLLTGMRPVVEDMKPTMAHFKAITARVDTELPLLIKNMDSFMDSGTQLIEAIDSSENRAKMRQLMANMRVITDNLKVVSSNAKALTTTLAETPWRLIWGGKTVQPPPEKQVLDSNKVIPIDNTLRPHSTESKGSAAAPQGEVDVSVHPNH